MVVDLPVGRNEWIGGDMNRALDAIIGGWSIRDPDHGTIGGSPWQSACPPRLASGTQRRVICSQLKTGTSMHEVALNWQNAGNGGPVFLNTNCFADPERSSSRQRAPRYFSGLRVDGIHNADLNFYKSFVPKEGMRIELRAEMFNLFNHPRFAQHRIRLLGSRANPFLGRLPATT